MLEGHACADNSLNRTHRPLLLYLPVAARLCSVFDHHYCFNPLPAIPEVIHE